jgi:uncharacterized protein YcfJ
MKKVFIISMLVSAGAAMAQEVYVMSVQPRLVTVNQQQCQVQEVVREGNNGSGTAIGAVAGGLLGSTLGGNRNDHLAGTVIGALIGGAIGNEMSREPARVEQRQVCRYVPVQVQQGEIVTFNYRGRVFTQTFGN